MTIPELEDVCRRLYGNSLLNVHSALNPITTEESIELARLALSETTQVAECGLRAKYDVSQHGFTCEYLQRPFRCPLRHIVDEQ